MNSDGADRQRYMALARCAPYAGPIDTVMSTADPEGTAEPGTGDMAATTPLGTDVDVTCVTAPSDNFAFSIATMASAWVRPIRLGTAIVGDGAAVWAWFGGVAEPWPRDRRGRTTIAAAINATATPTTTATTHHRERLGPGTGVAPVRAVRSSAAYSSGLPC